MLIGFLSGLFGCKAPPLDGVWKTLDFSQTSSNDSQCFFFEAKRTADEHLRAQLFDILLIAMKKHGRD